jgi:hypothetical protein
MEQNFKLLESHNDRKVLNPIPIVHSQPYLAEVVDRGHQVTRNAGGVSAKVLRRKDKFTNPCFSILA